MVFPDLPYYSSSQVCFNIVITIFVGISVLGKRGVFEPESRIEVRKVIILLIHVEGIMLVVEMDCLLHFSAKALKFIRYVALVSPQSTIRILACDSAWRESALGVAVSVAWVDFLLFAFLSSFERKR